MLLPTPNLLTDDGGKRNLAIRGQSTPSLLSQLLAVGGHNFIVLVHYDYWRESNRCVLSWHVPTQGETLRKCKIIELIFSLVLLWKPLGLNLVRIACGSCIVVDIHLWLSLVLSVVIIILIAETGAGVYMVTRPELSRGGPWSRVVTRSHTDHLATVAMWVRFSSCSAAVLHTLHLTALH